MGVGSLTQPFAKTLLDHACGATSYTPPATVNIGLIAAPLWQPGHTYAAGSYVVPRDYPLTQKVFKTISGGSSGSAEPAFDEATSGDVITDNTVTWVEQTLEFNAGNFPTPNTSVWTNYAQETVDNDGTTYDAADGTTLAFKTLAIDVAFPTATITAGEVVVIGMVEYDGTDPRYYLLFDQYLPVRNGDTLTIPAGNATVFLTLAEAVEQFDLNSVAWLFRFEDWTLAELYDIGDPVTLWPDLSGNDYDAAQSTSGKEPTYTADGVDFDGTQWLDLSPVSAETTHTMIFVLNPTPGPNLGAYVFDTPTGRYIIATETGNGSPYTNIAIYDGTAWRVTTVANTAGLKILTVAADGDGLGVNIYIDATSIYTGTYAPIAISGTAALGSGNGGPGGSGEGAYIGTIRAAYCYEGLFTSEEFAGVHAALSRRYGIAL